MSFIGRVLQCSLGLMLIISACRCMYSHIDRVKVLNTTDCGKVCVWGGGVSCVM